MQDKLTMVSPHYSGIRAKRSLIHFFIGKAAQAIAGITFLILMVRHMASSNYGAYVALLAILDIFYLVSGLGLSTIAQRYVAEFRMKASSRRLVQFLNHLFLKRVIYSLVFVVLVLLIRQWLLPLIGLELNEKWLLPLVLLFMASASVFFLDEVLGALLFQGLSQGLSFFRGLLRLLAISYYLHYSLPITIEWALMLECGVAIISLVAGHFFFRLQINSNLSHPEAHDGYENPIMVTTARTFYLVQLVGELYGPNIFKLLITRILGLTQTASFGFAQSVTDKIRNYLPAHLLAGWIRPLMISRYLARQKVSDLTDIANLILKLNLFGIAPLLVFFLLRGNEFGAWATGGHYPQAGNLLLLFSVMIGLQTIHLLFAMIIVTLEQASANLVATWIAAASMPFSLILIHAYGIEGATWGLLSSEIIWLLSAWVLLSRRGFDIKWDIGGMMRIALASSAAGIILRLSGFDQPITRDIIYSVAITGCVFFIFSILLKPLREPERILIRGLIPTRFIVW